MTGSTFSVLPISFLLFSATSALSLYCDNIVVDKVQFDLTKIGGPHSVSVIQEGYPTVYNTTWTVDLCKPLVIDSSVEQHHRCATGTQVCGIKRAYDDANDPNRTEVRIESVYSIAGNYATGSGKTLDPHYERLKTKEENLEGLELELHGGVNHEEKKQQAIIRLICDHDRTGNEGIQDAGATLTVRDNKQIESNTSLSYVSYNLDGEVDTLRLDWRTMYACENAVKDGKEESKGSWGFFTWLILLAFLGTAAYLIFGSWLNYNRYGARGWDLLPHGDTIRDIPYLFKDWSRKVVDTVSGNGSRGGYSAV